MILKLEDGSRATLLQSLQLKAHKCQSTWQIPELTEAEFYEGLRLIREFTDICDAAPQDIDDALWFAAGSLRRENYELALSIYNVVLLPLVDLELHCGYDVYPDEVLSYDLWRATASTASRRISAFLSITGLRRYFKSSRLRLGCFMTSSSPST